MDGKKFYIDVLEMKPEATISIIEIDFASPLDYKQPEDPAVKNIEKASMKVGKKERKVVLRIFRAFMGLAKRLDGFPVLTSVSATEECKQSVGRKRKVVLGSSNVGKPSEVELKKEDKKGRIMEKKKEEKDFQAFTEKKL
ncbi:uncharacterized protein LOC107416384 [Ziziphus jujuba]|uniref:Uncharacterized protein LOC107416384 n=2 Tax=Ziziphus jujuba TaxID=326968 RepID=A0A6P3ZMK0_ZIZJJ|nr:uncharacterized protein LOC107416384 [Ziziphus jujuba]KAH7533829.1 hypothetical protein FEM48_Zijuj04G0173200 [Ziziphus jujuba var. spinosa]